MFAPQLDGLSDTYRVIAYDQRSRTERWDEAYTLADLADDLLGLLDELEVATCVLVGTSVGGFIAQELALAHPDRVDGLVVISARLGAYEDEERTRFERTFGALDRDGAVPREFADWLAALILSERTREREVALVEHWLKRWCSRPARAVYREWRAWIEKEDHRERLAALTKPMLLVYGEDDSMLSLDRIAGATAELHDAEAVGIPGAGHVPSLENPDLVTSALGRFLERVYSARAG